MQEPGPDEGRDVVLVTHDMMRELSLELIPFLESYGAKRKLPKRVVTCMMLGQVGVMIASCGIDLHKSWDHGLKQQLFEWFNTEVSARLKLQDLGPADRAMLMAMARATGKMVPLDDNRKDDSPHGKPGGH